MEPQRNTGMRNRRQLAGMFAGPLLFALAIWVPPPAGVPPSAWEVAALALLMATWWLTEALPLAVTALLPLVLLPALGTLPVTDIAPAYANPLVFLFLGGFLIAGAIERWNLHRRIALHTVGVLGSRADRLVLGFMGTTALLSMWISNTAAAMMMAAIGMAVAKPGEEECRGFGAALMLGIAYGASIGGVASLIGTPPNAILAGIARSDLGIEIGFARWMAFGLPLAAVMLAVTWWLLTRFVFRLAHRPLNAACADLQRARESLGPASSAERRVFALFLLVAAAWLARGIVPGLLPAAVDDSVIALAGAVALFVIPAGKARRKAPLLDWATAARLPWDILVLFGGGFALAKAFSATGLTTAIAGSLGSLAGAPALAIIAGTALLVVFLTEVTSNTATASLFLPVVAAVAVTANLHPLALMVPTALAASFAFMLPVATPPNAIVFGTRQVSVAQMARAGLVLNLLGTLVLSLAVLWLLPLVFELPPGLAGPPPR
jgi:sodium-dependent dicarboxylate transporter 2/3/5